MNKTNLNHAENIYSLITAITHFEALTVEQAFQYYETGSKKTYLTDKDTEDMLVMKNDYHMSFSEIGEIYNLSGSAIYRRFEAYNKKHKNAYTGKITLAKAM